MRGFGPISLSSLSYSDYVMKQTKRLNASLTDEGRYRLLIDAVTDYAIYMLDPDISLSDAAIFIGGRSHAL